jgi:hypothetical protein
MPRRYYQLTVRNRAAAAAVGVAAIVVGGTLVALGLTLVAGIAVISTAAACGAMLYRKLAGRGALGAGGVHRGLDPRLEVYPSRVGDVPRLGGRRAD